METFVQTFFDQAIRVTYTDRGLTEISYIKKNSKNRRPTSAKERKMAKTIESYLKGGTKKLDLPIDWKSLEGTDFQKKVWRKMHKIPYGKVKSYGEIAKSIESPKAARAVGSACGKNPVLLAIPCHRVVGTNGLGGFSGGGLPVKRKLHKLEGIEL